MVSSRSFFPAILMGLVTTLIIALSVSLFVSLFLTFTSLTEDSFRWVTLTAAFIALFFGGAVSGAKAKSKGWIAGAFTALLFSLFTFMIQYLGHDQMFSVQQYAYHGGYLVTAALGGMIGVNLSGHSNKSRS